ncbi:hypothetical protein [Spirosoma luteolum]
MMTVPLSVYPHSTELRQKYRRWNLPDSELRQKYRRRQKLIQLRTATKVPSVAEPIQLRTTIKVPSAAEAYSAIDVRGKYRQVGFAASPNYDKSTAWPKASVFVTPLARRQPGFFFYFKPTRLLLNWLVFFFLTY